jgi:hypothetical protein
VREQRCRATALDQLNANRNYYQNLTMADGGGVDISRILSAFGQNAHVYTLPVAAVLQAISEDGGKTWSAPMVTEDAQIFDIGKGWIEQRFRARPVSLNGKPLQ